MSVQSETWHRTLRPATPLAAAVMLTQVCTGTLVVAMAVLLVPRLVAFELVLLFASGLTLAAIAVRDAERDRSILPRERWPSWRARAMVWLSVVIFVSGPLVLTALAVERFAPQPIAIAVVVGVSTLGWALTAYKKLHVDALWLPRPRDEEAEAGLSIGALVLTATLVVGWMLIRIEATFDGGPLPSSLSAGMGFLLSVASTLIVGLGLLLPMAMKWTLRGSTPIATHWALAALLLPVAVLVLLPMHRWGQPLPEFIPAYTSAMAGRVFLSAVLAFSIVEFVRSRHSNSKADD